MAWLAPCLYVEPASLAYLPPAACPCCPSLALIHILLSRVWNCGKTSYISHHLNIFTVLIALLGEHSASIYALGFKITSCHWYSLRAKEGKRAARWVLQAKRTATTARTTEHQKVVTIWHTRISVSVFKILQKSLVVLASQRFTPQSYSKIWNAFKGRNLMHLYLYPGFGAEVASSVDLRLKSSPKHKVQLMPPKHP